MKILAIINNNQNKLDCYKQLKNKEMKKIVTKLLTEKNFFPSLS